MTFSDDQIDDQIDDQKWTGDEVCVCCGEDYAEFSYRPRLIPYGSDVIIFFEACPVWTCANCGESYSRGDQCEEIEQQIIIAYRNRFGQ